jgi:RNA polymerase sigma factor (sigma-70 family)
MISEADLIRLCNRSDRKGQQLLFDRFKGKVMNVCLRFASSRLEADDILQEAFIKIFNSLVKDKSIKIDSLAAWVHRITLNTAINIYHREQRNEGMLHLSDFEQDGNLQASESVLQDMDAEELLTLIRQMPTGYRLVFNLNIIEGFDHKEIGEKLQITESASRSQLSRAKVWLREHINNKSIVSYEQRVGR